MPTKAELEDEVEQLRRRVEQQSQSTTTDTSPSWTSEVLEKLIKVQGEQMQSFMLQQNQEVDARLERFLGRFGQYDRETQDHAAISTSERLPTTPKAIAKPPPPLEGGINYRQWKQWLGSWKNYAILVKIDGLSREEQIASFRSFCSPELLAKMEFSMNIPANTPDSMDQVFETISKFLKMKHNVALDRFRLLNRHQEQGEQFDEFYTALQEMAAEAELREMSHDDWIATLILVGTSDDKIRQELLSKVVPPTLEETVAMRRNEEKGRLGVRDLQRPERVAIGAYKARTP
eukprot:TCALIF_10441-PA protein Name:"Protein of unknown function" AED:0.47 eAED:0.48 QI:0/-1/0/1/-1/1/1/0/289